MENMLTTKQFAAHNNSKDDITIVLGKGIMGIANESAGVECFWSDKNKVSTNTDTDEIYKAQARSYAAMTLM